MSEPDQQLDSQSWAFLRIWTESWSKLGQAAFSFSPEAAPPELLRQIRSGMFQALAQSWDEFLRSPQFMQSMKEMMDQAIAFRKLSNDFFAKARSDMGAVDQEDVYGLALGIRQLESRVLERMDGISTQLAGLNQRLEVLETVRAKPVAGALPRRAGGHPRRASKPRRAKPTSS